MDDFPEIPGYEILSVVGQGSVATVYLAIQEKLKVKVAIKILRPTLMKEDEYSRRFIREAQIAANLNHPNTIQIYDIGKHKNYHYIIMEYLEDSLKERMERIPGRKMPPESALNIVERIMQALDYAHFKGVIHRDIKPAHIMFRQDNTPVLVDFGLVYLLGSEDEPTKEGIIIGTALYMSPEQCRGEKVDDRSDIYSLGVVLYEMLTGRSPYISESIFELLKMHINLPVPQLPLELRQYQPLIGKMMVKNKEARLASFPEFEQLLDRILIQKSKERQDKDNNQRLQRLSSIIRLLDSSELKMVFLPSGKIITIDINKRKILEKKPIFTVRRNLRYYWVSTSEKAENQTACVIKGHPDYKPIIVNIWYEVECVPQKEEKVVLALSKKNKPDEALNEFIENWLQDFVAEKRKEGVNPILEYYNFSEELKNYLCKKAAEEVGLNMECSLSLKYEEELKEYKIDFDSFPVRVKDSADELSLKFSTRLSVSEKNKIFAILNYPYLEELELLVQGHIKETIKKYITYHDFAAELNSSVKQKITRSLNQLLEKKGRVVAWIKLQSNIVSESHGYNEESRILIEKERYDEALLIIVEAENQRLADDNTRALKKKVIKSLSDDEEQSFKRRTKEGKSINYPESGSILGRDEKIKSGIKIMDKTPIIIVYGITGIGKSVFIHELRKSESHNSRLYKRIIAEPGITVNDLFQQLALLLGCRDMLNQPEFNLSEQSDFSFLETEAQYRLASLIHLDDAQHLFLENQFRNNAIKEFLLAVTQYYPDTRIILECRIVPPAGIFTENIHQSIRLHGIDEVSMILYFKQPFKNATDLGWELEEHEQELLLKNLCSKGKGNIHPLAMVLLANRAYQSKKRPMQIIKDPEAMKELIDESGDLILNDLNQATMQDTGPNISLNIKMYNEDIPAYLSESLEKCIRELNGDEEIEDLVAALTIVDKRENELRNAVSKKLYKEGQEHLQETIKLDKERKERLKEEFGYIYDVDNLEADENEWAKKQGQIEWRRKVWQVLSSRNNFELPSVDTGEPHEDRPEENIDSIDGKKEIKESKKIVDKDKRTPEKIGEELEKAVLKLFKDFFDIWEEDNTLTLINARQQGRSLQFGHDLKFVCGRLGDKEIRFLIECKNYSKKITTTDIADKLMQVDEYYEKDHIDHWILISPNEDVSNELENLAPQKNLWVNCGSGKFPSV
jgi:serine/threonine protein kinase